MLRNGVFTYQGVTYTVVEIDEPGFYRIDFLQDGAKFQVDIEGVAYSQVHRKSIRYVGDTNVYTQYTNAITLINNVQLKREVREVWEDGAFVVYETGVNEKQSCYAETKTVNGVLTECTYKVRGVLIGMVVVQDTYGVKLEPLNYSDYRELMISSDTVTNTDGSRPYYTLDVLCRRYNLSHIEDKDYVVVQSEEVARIRLQHWVNAKSKFKAVDTETSGVDVDMCGQDYLVGIILSEDTNTATYFPVRHELFWNMPKELLDEVMQAIKSQEDYLVGANIKFDRKVFLKEGYDITFAWDTMQLSIIEHPFLERGVHTLKQRATEANGKFYLELDHIFINKSDIDFSVLPIDIVKYYACPDGTNTLEVLYMLLNKIPKYQWKLCQLESYLANVKADMEFYGIRVNVKRYEEQYNNCNYIIKELLRAFRVLTKSDCNINSGVELGDLIYNKMHCEVLARTKTGQPSVALLALNKLAKERRSEPADPVEDIADMFGNVIVSGKELCSSKYPALVVLSKYKEYMKLQTSFYARFERTLRTGRVFFWVNQNGAASGRQSSPMHQLPPELKSLIVSDSVQHDLWGPDFSQIEIRMIAYLAGEKDLIERCSDPDNDIHRVIGSLISGKEMWQITPEERSAGKRRNFGFVYLISGFGLARQVFNTPMPTKEQVKYAQEQLDALFHRFKYINRYIKRNAQEVQQRGYMETAWYHRKRYFNEIFDRDLEPRRKQSILRMANNMPVQGTAADYLKLAEVQMFRYIREKGWHVRQEDGFPLVRMLLSIHDEILISAHQSIPKEEIVLMIKTCMETPVKDAPPFFVSPALMSDWEGHSDDSLAMPIRLRDKIIEDYKNRGTRVFMSNYYKVEFPDEVKGLRSSTDVDSISEDILNKLKFTLLTEIPQFTTPVSKYDRIYALKAYVDFGADTYVQTNYREVLSSFRKDVLQTYMQGLISKCGNDYVALGKEIRHPSLTHQLLDVYKQQLKPLGLSHEESITMAAKLYLEDMHSNENRTPLASIESDARADEETDVKPLDTLVYIDNDGNVIYEEDEVSSEECMSEEELDLSAYRLNERVPYVWELADSILFDVQDIKLREDVDRVLDYIFQSREDDGFYRTYIIYNGTAMNTKIRVENIDMKAANDFIYTLLENQTEGGVTCGRDVAG